MPAPYCYDYPRPAVTVDLAAFVRSAEGLRVLLIRRKHAPFTGQWALPGGFLEIDEPIERAARRELKEETGLEVAGPITFLGVYGDPGRDPRGRTISVVYLALLPGAPPEIAGGDDAAEAAWLGPFAASGLAFDHDKVLADALRQLAAMVDGPAGLALLPDAFKKGDVRRLLAETRAPEAATADRWVKRALREGLIEPAPGRVGWYRKKP